MTSGPKSTFSKILIGLVAVAAMAACSASTAHISDLTIAKDKDMSTPATTFGKTDTIYAASGLANIPSKTTLVMHTIAEKVDGQAPNTTIPSLDKSFDMDSDGTASYTLTPPTNGWPAGTYKIEADMMVDGAQKATKTAEFTISGS
jgi:hypothetical protein